MKTFPSHVREARPSTGTLAATFTTGSSPRPQEQASFMIVPRKTSSPRVLAHVLIALLAVAVAVSGCAKQQRSRTQRVSVTVAPAMQRAMPFALEATGTVEPLRTASVGSQVGGVVTQVLFREGQEVRAGQVLIQIDPRPFRTALEQARAQLARDKAQAETARLDAERAQKLVAGNVISQAEWEQKKSAAEAWTGTVRSEEASVAARKLDLEYASIRAPIAGRTGALQVHVGDYVKSATSEPLVTINQIHPVRVRFTVPETDVAMVQQYRNRNPRVVVTPSSGDSVDLTGGLVFVDNAVDPTSGTLLLKGEFQNQDERLVPGQFVKVRLVLYEDPAATVVPAPAVTAGQEGSFVYVLNPDSTVTPRPVEVARTVDDIAIVQRGLQPGEVVVTDGQLRLSPGAKVLIRDERAARQGAPGAAGDGPAAGDMGRGAKTKSANGAAQAAEREGAKGGSSGGGSR